LKYWALTAALFLLASTLAFFSFSGSTRANPDETDNFAEAMGLAPGEFLSWTLGDSDSLGAAIFSADDFPSPGSSVTSFPFPTEGTTFVVLSSGAAAAANTANSGGSLSTVLSGLNTNEGNDLVQLTLEIRVPEDAESFMFDFMFCSEEWPEYYGSDYNDAFLAEVGASTFVVNPDETITAPNNVATDPNGNQVTVNVGYGLDPDNPYPDTGTTYDGCTNAVTVQVSLTLEKSLTSSSVIKKMTALTLYFSILDVGDSVFDSAVFLDNFRFSTEGGEGFEVCDGKDNDGDTQVDEGFPDSDGDTDAHRHRHANANAHQHLHAHPNGYADPNPHPPPQINPNGDLYPDGNGRACTATTTCSRSDAPASTATGRSHRRRSWYAAVSLRWASQHGVGWRRVRPTKQLPAR